MQYRPNNGAGRQDWNGNSYFPPRPSGPVPLHLYHQNLTNWHSRHHVPFVQTFGQAYPREYNPSDMFEPQPHPTIYDSIFISANQGFDTTVDPSIEQHNGNINARAWETQSDNYQGTLYPNNEWTLNWDHQPPAQKHKEPPWKHNTREVNYEVYNPPARGRTETHHNDDIDYRSQEPRSISEYRPIPPLAPPIRHPSPSKNQINLPDIADEDLRYHQQPLRCRSRSPIHHSFTSRQHTSLEYEHRPSNSSSYSSANRPLFPCQGQDRQAVQRHILAAASSERISPESLLSLPGRRIRPPKILIILRGLPGTGKSTVARLIKNKETQAAIADKQQPACRLISIDDFYMTENEEANSGSAEKYVYDADMEEVYKRQLVKLTARQMDNDFFNLLIVDSVNQRISELDELASQARMRGFQVYIVEVTANLNTCVTRSIGRRSREDILQLHRNWEPTSSRFTVIDANSLQQEVSVEEVEMESDNDIELEKTKEMEKQPSLSKASSSTPSIDTKFSMDDEEDDDASETERSCWGLVKSKWDKEDNFRRLERLDGLNRRLSHSASSDILSMTDYLQTETNKYRERKAGVKRVTWADLEALRSNSRRRDLGFVIGQTDWSHLTGENDERTASEALVRTKYF